MVLHPSFSRYALIFFGSLQLLCATGFSTELKDLPDEVLVQILQELDPDNFTSMAQTNNQFHALATDPSLKKKVIERFYENEISKINRISTLSKRELEKLLDEKTILTKKLLQKSTMHDVRTMKSLILEKKNSGTFDRDRAYVAAFLAKFSINFMDSDATQEVAENAAWHAARARGGESIYNVLWNDAQKAAREAAVDSTSDTAWKVVCNTAFDVATIPAWRDAFYAACHAVDNVAKNDVSNKVQLVLVETLKILNLTDIGKTAYDLSKLSVLDRFRISNRQTFEEAFNSAYNALVDGLISINQASEIIAEHINKESISNNLFIQDLKSFLNQTEQMLLN